METWGLRAWGLWNREEEGEKRMGNGHKNTEEEEDGIRLVGLRGQKLGHGSLKLIILFSNFSIFFVNSRFTCHTSLLYFPPHFSRFSVVS